MLARVAQTLRTVGRDDLASPLREQAARNLPGTRTIWEQVLLGPDPGIGTAAGASGSPEAVVRLRALAPDLVIEVDGEAHPLGRLPARIIGLLVAAGRPLTIDQVVDAIWPDVELDAAKHRLAMALHRLRSALPAAAAAIVVRDQHGLRLAAPADGVRSDVADLLAVDPDDLAAATAAVLAYESDFGERQLAYEDWALATREWCRARCALMAGRILDAHLDASVAAPVDSAEALAVAAHVRHLAVTDGALAERVVRTYTVAGRPGEATALVADAARAACSPIPSSAASRG